MRQISADTIRKLLPMDVAIDLMRETMQRVSAGAANLPLRSVVEIEGANRLGIMPGVLHNPTVYGVKLLSLFPGNPAAGRSSHLGVIVLFDADTGEAVASLDADAVTAIRTAAATAAATDALATSGARRLALIGTGEQAVSHIEALSLVRPLERVTVAGRTPERAEAFVAAQAPRFRALALHAAPSAQAAAEAGEIVCTLTSSADIVLRGAWIGPGQHVNAVGASVPSSQEIDLALVEKARLFTDHRPSAMAQARDLIEAEAHGHLTDAHPVHEIGELFAGRLPARHSERDITLYRSLGIAAQDLACADYIFRR